MNFTCFIFSGPEPIIENWVEQLDQFEAWVRERQRARRRFPDGIENINPED